VSESTTLTGLQPDTTYYYRTVATNSVGSAVGSILSFTTTTGTPTTLALTPSVNPSTVGQSVSFTAVVAPQSGTGTPAGNVVFDIDGSATTTSEPLSVVNGVDEAVLTTTFTAGSHGIAIAAQYQGGGTFSASPAVAITETVNPTNLALTVTTLPPTGITSTTATLNGTVNPNGTSTDASFLYSTNSTLSAVVTTLAGMPGILGEGSADGTGAAAQFFEPTGVAVDPTTGNVYVADLDNDTIRMITPGGVVTTLAGSPGQAGSADGTGAAAQFNGPSDVAVDAAGNVYVADTFNDTIRKITPAGVVTTLAGSPGQVGSTDGTGAAARFDKPIGVAVDAAGNVYVADTYNDTIRMITPAGVVTTLVGSPGQAGSADGTGPAARFDFPSGVAVDAAGNVYVGDTYNYTIRMITPGGVVTTLAGAAGHAGSTDGTGAAAQFFEPTGVAVDAAGNVYVADSYAFRQFHAPLEIYGGLQTVLIVSMSSRTAHRLLTASSCNAS
jgi:sugar lactone lactonase YvrE